MRILVTGGAGFLGSHLIDELLSLGHSVISLDNYVTGSRENIAHNLNNPKFEAIRHDVTFPFFAEVDGIFNLACPASPVHYQKDPVQTLKTSVHGAINMLGLAKRTKARILQASTSEVYGDPEINPQIESYWGHVNPTGIRACYDEGKRAAETLFSDYFRQHQVDVRIPRIFNTYGPRMALDDGRVVSTLIIQALRNEDLTLFGDGTQTRSFCYVDDLVAGLIKLFFTDGINEPLNLGNPSPISMNHLAQEIIEITNSTSNIKYTPLPSDDPKLREPDITKARELIGWEPRVERRRGLELTASYFEKAITLSA
jgi:UDP-glucuronate decarboxylase